MPSISVQEVFEKFKQNGRNSSHFVWFLCELKFFQASNGWIFGFWQRKEVFLFALEPLIPGAPTQFEKKHIEEFVQAWGEFNKEFRPKIYAFVSVYTEFIELLKQQGFQTLKIGQEPWIDLRRPFPTGNAGKGVRAARNQAIRAGVIVEEWDSSTIIQDRFKREAIQSIYEKWRHNRILELSGFMNSTDPFAFSEMRRYFVAYTLDSVHSNRMILHAYLVCTPIPGIRSYFLEDMVIGENAPRGTGDFLTSEGLKKLAESNYSYASLGVVAATQVSQGSLSGLPGPIMNLVTVLPKVLKKIYNFNGLENFRKRFKPSRWDNVFLAVRNDPSSGVSDQSAWLKVLITLGLAFKPRFNLALRNLVHPFIRFFRNYPVSSVVTLASYLLFIFVNHWGSLPPWALAKFGFSGSLPMHEWFHRSIVSDLLYFDVPHFAIWGNIYFILLFMSERSYSKRFFIPYFIGLTLFDDFINYACIIKPFVFFQPHLFHHLVTHKDVGGSLCMIALFGLQLCRLRKNRELLFVGIAVISVFAYVFLNDQLSAVVLNLNHFLLFSLGYVSGKIRFEFGRLQSKKVSKLRSPEMIQKNAA